MNIWRGRVTSTAAVYIAACLIIIGLYAGSSAVNNQFDDTYITYRYAINLASGRGFVFNIGERIDSASSFSYTILLALAYRAGLHDLETVATVIGVACAAGISAVVFRSILHLTGHAYLAVTFAALTCLHGFISAWSISGMESVPYAFLVTLFVHRFFIVGDTSRKMGVLLGVILLSRLEGLLLFGACGFLLLIGIAREGLRRQWPVARALLVAAALGAGLTLFRYGYYGTWVPHSFLFKKIWSAYQPNPDALIEFWQSTALGVVMLAVGGIGALRNARRSALVLYIGVSFVSVLFGPSASWARYSIHLLPVLFILAAPPMAFLLKRMRPLALAFAVLIAVQTAHSARDVRKFMVDLSTHQKCRKQLGKRLEQMKPEGDVLSSDIGAIAYEAPSVAFIDTVGLTSPGILNVYLKGGSLDPAFIDKRPEFVADTVQGDAARRQYKALLFLEKSSRYIKTRVSPPDFLSKVREVERIDECRSADGLIFAIGRLGPR